MILVCPQVIPIRDGVNANSERSFIVVGMILEMRKPQHHQRILISTVWGGTQWPWSLSADVQSLSWWIVGIWVPVVVVRTPLSWSSLLTRLILGFKKKRLKDLLLLLTGELWPEGQVKCDSCFCLALPKVLEDNRILGLTWDIMVPGQWHFVHLPRWACRKVSAGGLLHLLMKNCSERLWHGSSKAFCKASKLPTQFMKTHRASLMNLFTENLFSFQWAFRLERGRLEIFLWTGSREHGLGL